MKRVSPQNHIRPHENARLTPGSQYTATVAAAKVPNIPPILLFDLSGRKPEAGNVRCRFVGVLIVQKREEPGRTFSEEKTSGFVVLWCAVGCWPGESLWTQGVEVRCVRRKSTAPSPSAPKRKVSLLVPDVVMPEAYCSSFLSGVYYCSLRYASILGPNLWVDKPMTGEFCCRKAPSTRPKRFYRVP